jgi:hypothetical protein
VTVRQFGSKQEKLTHFRGILDRALGEVSFAEKELERAVHHLAPLAVGDKELITPALEGSFDRLHRARSCVAGLRLMLSRL